MGVKETNVIAGFIPAIHFTILDYRYFANAKNL